jgi:hypothetical protein
MRIKVEHCHDYEEGWNDALADLHGYLMASYQTCFDWETINLAIQEVKLPGGGE